MVVNAPQSNVISAAEHTVALILAQARNIPQAHAALRDGRWERAGSRASSCTARPSASSASAGSAPWSPSAATPSACGSLAYDPFVSRERAAQMGVELASLAEVLGRADVITIHLPKTPETIGLIGEAELAASQARGPPGQHGQGRDRRRGRPGQGGRRRPARPGPPSTCSPRSRPPRARCSSWTASWSPPTSAPPPRSPGQGRHHHRRAAPARPGRPVRAQRGQRRRRPGARRPAPVRGAGREAGAAVRGPGRRRPGGRTSAIGGAGSRSTTSGPWSSRTPGC